MGDAFETYHDSRRKYLKPCPECGSSNTDFHVPEKGALGIFCEDCDWSIDAHDV